MKEPNAPTQTTDLSPEHELALAHQEIARLRKKYSPQSEKGKEPTRIDDKTASAVDIRQAAIADDVAVTKFSWAMMRKMAASRAKGRGGWQTCSVDDLWEILIQHIEKGDPVDVACIAMMIHHNQEAAR